MHELVIDSFGYCSCADKSILNLDLFDLRFFAGSSRYIRADSSFIFSFRNRDFLEPFKSPVHQNKAYAIYTSYNNGPVFGANNHDIFIANNAIAGKSSYTNFGNTYKLPPGYSFNTHKAKHLLAGEFNFTPSDVEVYYYVNDEH